MTSNLVTGGAGFIGSHLVRALLERGDRVRVLDDMSTGHAENLPQRQPRLEVIQGDVCNPVCVADAVQGIEQIYHLAAQISVPGSMQDPPGCMQVNVQGTLTLLEAARRSGVERIVLSSSCAVYGDAPNLPLNEDTPLHPLSPYALSKQMAEMAGALYTEFFDLPVVSLRYFNVYGPRQTPDSAYAAVIPIFVRRCLDGQPPVVYGDGTQGRDFCFVADVVRANLLAAETSTAGGRALNVCTGRETSLLDLLAVLKQILPAAPATTFAPPRPGDVYRSAGDPGRAAQVLGFEAQTSLLDGLGQVVEWMRSRLDKATKIG